MEAGFQLINCRIRLWNTPGTESITMYYDDGVFSPLDRMTDFFIRFPDLSV